MFAQHVRTVLRTLNRSTHPLFRWRGTGITAICWLMLACLSGGHLDAQPPSSLSATGQAKPRCVIIELYVQKDDEDCKKATEVIKTLTENRRGLVIAKRHIDVSDKNLERFQRVAKHFRVGEAKTPLIYACNRVISGPRAPEACREQLKRFLKMEVFVRRGCSRCARAKVFLTEFMRRYPGFEIVYRDVKTDARAVADMNRLVSQHRASAASVPVFHFCNRLVVGFSSASFTGKRLGTALERWTVPCPERKSNVSAFFGPSGSGMNPIVQTANFRAPCANSSARRVAGVERSEPCVGLRPQASARDFARRAASRHRPGWEFNLSRLHIALIQHVQPGFGALSLLASESLEDSQDANSADDEFELPLPPPPLPLPSEDEFGDDLPLVESGEFDDPAADIPQSVELPVFGELQLNQVGLPALTIAIGLVDGFNPCAMWVLLFLLSLLVNLKDRMRILTIAGTFIFISGLAYFAFMAAWLNVFLFIGYLRPIQIALGLIAIVVGSIHIKDFVASKRGFSLSIPESAKPTIYARTRKIITAENLVGALLGASLLAVLVNMVELLCTAGLPALYTEILAMQNLAPWQNYAYLALYNVAYMFDDSIMAGVVITTLGKRKLQENQGRWLKLVSGAVIAALGAVMIVNPDLLV